MHCSSFRASSSVLNFLRMLEPLTIAKPLFNWAIFNVISPVYILLNLFVLISRYKYADFSKYKTSVNPCFSMLFYQKADIQLQKFTFFLKLFFNLFR